VRLKTVSHIVSEFILLVLFMMPGCGPASMVSSLMGEEGGIGFCRPEGRGPFPTVIYNHGLVVDLHDVAGAARKRGYNLRGICQALASNGYLTFTPVRRSGRGNIPGHKEEVFRAVDYVKTLPDVDPSRIALMGFSRGGLLTLMVGVERSDLKALLILAPAPGGKGDFAKAVKSVASINAPVLLLVEAGDGSDILENFSVLERALRAHHKEVRSIIYNRGGGHELFYDVGYYWEDVRAFLREKLGGTPSQ